MEHIAFFGTGLMGVPMAKRLLEHSYPVTVFNRTQAKTQPLLEQSAELAEQPGAALE